jgi:hypothetical protein
VARNPGDEGLAANLARADDAIRTSENIENVSRTLVIRGPGLVQ